MSDAITSLYQQNRDSTVGNISNWANQSIADLQDAYGKRAAANKAAHDATLGTITDTWTRGNDKVKAQAAGGLQDAYVQSMMGKRNLNQQLAASGRSGGAAESTMLGLENALGKNRGTIMDSRDNQLADLLLAYNTDKNAAVGEYQRLVASETGSLADAINKIKADQALQIKAADDLLAQQRGEYMLQLQQQQQAAAAAARSGGGSGRSSGGGSGSGTALSNTSLNDEATKRAAAAAIASQYVTKPKVSALTAGALAGAGKLR